MTARFNRWLLALLLIIGPPYYWLLIDDRPGQVQPHEISIRQLRGLARSMPGLAPTTISYQGIGGRLVPRTVLAAGQGVKLVNFIARAYRLTVPNEQPIVIDSGLSADAAKQHGLWRYDARAQAWVTDELKQAQLVITLSDNDLHSGGLRLAGLARPARTSEAGAGCPGPRALAPGVVEIPVCGKVIASRMVYVRLADGREYLLTGDIAPTLESVLYQAGPSRLMNDFASEQDRTAIHSWLLTLRNLSKQAPNMTIVPGHSELTGMDLRRGFRQTRKR